MKEAVWTYDNDEFPIDSRKVCAVLYDHLVRCTDNRELICWFALPVQIRKKLCITKHLAVVGFAMIHDDGDSRCPFPELVHPI